MSTLVQSMRQNGLLLALFAGATALLITGTFQLTEARIVQQQRQAEARALNEVVAPDQHDNALLEDTLLLDSQTPFLQLRAPRKLYRARQAGNVMAVIVPVVAHDGYSGDIELIVGVDLQRQITGVRVLSHRETPGLGDKVDYQKSHWVDGFVGRSLGNPTAEQWAVKRDKGIFDQFTGATITPRAVTGAVKRALHYVDQHFPELFHPVEETPHG